MISRFPFLALARREITAGLRSEKLYLVCAAMLTLLILIVVLPWPRNSDQFASDIYSSTESTYTVIMFIIGSWLFLVSPILGAASLGIEKDRDTFDMLLNTLVSRPGIVFGKALAAIVMLSLVWLSALPVFGTAFFTIGFGWGEVLNIALVVFQLMVMGVGAGILMASFGRKLYSTLLLSLAVCFLASFIAFIAPELLDDFYPWVEDLEAFAYLPMGILLLALACLVLYLKKEKDARSGNRSIRDERILVIRRRRFPYYLVDPFRPRANIADEANPFFRLEMLSGAFRPRSFPSRAAYYSIFIVMFISGAHTAVSAHTGLWGQNEDQLSWAILYHAIGATLMCPLFFMGAISRERDRDSLDLLIMTTSDPASIVTGKYRAGLTAALTLLTMSALCLLPAALLQPDKLSGLGRYFAGYGTMTVSLFVCSSLAMFASTLGRGTIAAMAGAYFLAALFMVIFFLVAALVDEASSISLDDYVLAFLSPLVAYFFSFEEASPKYGVSLYWAANVAFNAALGGVFLFLAGRLFRLKMARGA